MSRDRSNAERARVLKERGVTDSLIALATGVVFPRAIDSRYCLSMLIRDVEWDLVNETPGMEDPVLLWGDGSVVYLLDFPGDTKRFLELVYEESRDDCTIDFGSSNQSMMAQIICDLTWFGRLGFGDSTLFECSDYLGYRHLNGQSQFVDVPSSDIVYRTWRTGLRDES